ncbi:MAG: heme exporter protein CcmD [Aromatoleum sp.]|nr:heme exporter protein CcmD [Aromatoleum sp.]
MSEFLAMGGYGFYVWSSYAAMAVVIGLEIRSVRSRRKTIVEEARLTVPEATTSLFPRGHA